jgi:hypothetical protein
MAGLHASFSRHIGWQRHKNAFAVERRREFDIAAGRIVKQTAHLHPGSSPEPHVSKVDVSRFSLFRIVGHIPSMSASSGFSLFLSWILTVKCRQK